MSGRTITSKSGSGYLKCAFLGEFSPLCMESSDTDAKTQRGFQNVHGSKATIVDDLLWEISTNFEV